MYSIELLFLSNKNPLPVTFVSFSKMQMNVTWTPRASLFGSSSEFILTLTIALATSPNHMISRYSFLPVGPKWYHYVTVLYSQLGGSSRPLGHDKVRPNHLQGVQSTAMKRCDQSWENTWGAHWVLLKIETFVPESKPAGWTCNSSRT